MLTEDQQGEQQEQGQPAATGDGETVTIDLDDVAHAESDDAGDDEAPPAPAQPQDRASKKRERAARHRELKENLAAAERRERESAERIARLESAMREMSQRVLAPQPPPQAQQAGDQGDRELEDIYEQQKTIALRVQYDRNITAEELNQLERRARQLDTRKTELVAERAARRAGGGRQQAMDPVQAGLMVQYSDVYADPQALGWAEGWARQQAAVTGRADLGLVRESFERARQWRAEQRGLPPATPPDSLRAKLTGPPGGRQGGGGAGGGPKAITLNRAQQRMALAMYPSLSEKEALQRWAHGPGKRVVTGGGK